MLHLVLTCTRHLVSSYVLAGLFFDNSEPSCSDPKVQQKRGGILLWKPWTSSRCIESAIAHSWPVSLDRFTRFPFVVREYLLVLFVLCDYSLRLFDVIFMLYWITPYDNCVLRLLCWNVYYHCASVLWFLLVLMLTVYMWGYFCHVYIRRSNISVPEGSGCYTYKRVLIYLENLNSK